MPTIESATSEIMDEFGGQIEHNEAEIEKKLTTVINEYKIPAGEAKRIVRNNIMDGLSDSSSENEFDPTPIGEINEEGEWNDILAEVVELWDPNSPQMKQTGLLGDESDVIKFTIWDDIDAGPLEEDETYQINNVVTQYYEPKDRHSIKFTNVSEAEPTDTEIESESNGVNITGPLIDVKGGSGLIKRCPDEDCTRVLNNGRCQDHGEPNDGGEFDMRIKGVVDDGAEAHNVIFGAEVTQELANMDLEEAKQMAMDELDTKVVQDEIEAQLIGTFFEINGPKLGQNILADTVRVVTGVEEETIKDLKSQTSSGPEAATTDPATASA